VLDQVVRYRATRSRGEFLPPDRSAGPIAGPLSISTRGERGGITNAEADGCRRRSGVAPGM